MGIDRPRETIERAGRIVAGEFEFLGHIERIDNPDWHRRYATHLWSYHLHYFDYGRVLAWAYRYSGDIRYVSRFAQLVASWIEGTYPGRGDGWDPYPTSVRIVNWIHALLVLGTALDAGVRETVSRSLALQASWLERRLEWHIHANHLQKNFAALGWAGLFFEGPDAERWRRRGLRGAWSSVRDQVLEDGVHYERSPMYHAIALADLLELIAGCRAAGIDVPGDVEDRVRRMVVSFGVFCRPNGALHLFNDATTGGAPTRMHLDRLGATIVGVPVPAAHGPFELPQAGYYGYAAPTGDRLLLDCGAPGPRHQPGHAHCDVLSFELDFGGRPVVVDSGVHGYEGDPYRHYARSTRAHNTVAVNGREQSEIWGAFRMARMAKVQTALAAVTAHDEYSFTGCYSPYFDRRVRHERTFHLRAGSLVVRDRVRAPIRMPVQSYLHFHPRFKIRGQEDATVLLTDVTGEGVRVVWHGTNRIRVGRGAGDPEGWYLPEFGCAEPAVVVVGEGETNDGGEPFGYDITRI